MVNCVLDKLISVRNDRSGNIGIFETMDIIFINAFHSYKLKQILLVVHPGFGQDMPA